MSRGVVLGLGGGLGCGMDECWRYDDNIIVDVYIYIYVFIYVSYIHTKTKLCIPPKWLHFSMCYGRTEFS